MDPPHPYPVPEFVDPVFTKTSPKRSFSLNRKRAFWLVFAKTGSIISGTEHCLAAVAALCVRIQTFLCIRFFAQLFLLAGRSIESKILEPYPSVPKS
jgi:hypothetical protein